MTELSIDRINAMPKELEPFHKLGQLWEKVEQFITPINIGDWIRVASGACVGMAGKTIEVLDMAVRVTETRKDGHWEGLEIFSLH